MAGIIAVDTIQNGSGASVPTTTVINGSAKAWCKALSNGTVIGSFNVSSVTIPGSGVYDFTFTTPIINSNYVAASTNWGLNSGSQFATVIQKQLSSHIVVNTNSTASDGGTSVVCFSDN